MVDYTDPDLLPFPVEEDYGDLASGVEELARAIDPLIVAQNARITTLTTRPTVIRSRTTDVGPLAGGFADVTTFWNSTDHNNFSAPGPWATPAVGAHAVAGVYPALWRFDLYISITATGAVVGQYREVEVQQLQVSAIDGIERTTRRWVGQAAETNTGGEHLTVSGAMLLAEPARYTVELAWDATNVTMKASSWMSMTRIRSV